MPRIARIVVPGEPHHIVQRGNRRLPTFFEEDDYRYYLKSMRHRCDKHSVDIWAYCLMTNHIHLIAVPKTEQGLSLAIGEAHKQYTKHINSRERWSGYLWQGRFSSYPMDQTYLLAAARYIEQNPVRAGMVANAADYAWSSAQAHVAGKDDGLVAVKPMLSLVRNWKSFISTAEDDAQVAALKQRERTGRPLGDDSFFDRLHALLGRDVRPKKPGPQKKS